jgi:non-specific serine/threonine protein kinase
MDFDQRLRAVLAADVAGYGELMAADERSTVVALNVAREIFREEVRSHHGRLVDTAGDSVLAVFDTSIGAAEAAVDVQRRLDRTDANLVSTRRLRFRIGVHLGDLLGASDGTVYGQGVNIAARLQALAPPGGVVVSAALHDAIRAQRGWTFADLGVHTVKNIAYPIHAFAISDPLELVRPPADSLTASAREESLGATPNNLPHQASSFVARERELAEIASALAATRMLTLAGLGGIGKTRLALHAAADAADDFPDGVWLCDLSAIADERLVPQTVAMVLGVQQSAANDAAGALLRFVAGRKLLIVLDNCEHLLQACAELASALLRSGGAVKIIATSRESLRIAGETTYLVPSLALPDGADIDDAAAALRYGAVRLFLERASAAQSGFALTAHVAQAVVEICRHVDGIPLAIELAAARVRSMAISEIAERLNDRLRLLTGGPRTSAPRHQTLRACLDWSHEFLAANEQKLLRRLSVFSGSWTLEAAEGVCAGGPIERPMVLDLLSALIDKSLVQFDAQAARYRMLETVRAYAGERLRGSPEEHGLHTAYVRFYVELGECARNELRGPRQAEWLVTLDHDRENLLAAHERSDRAEGGTELDLRLVEPLARYCLIKGMPQLGQRVVAEALTRGETHGNDRAHCDALFAGAQVAAHLGRYDEARSYLDRSLAMAKELGDTNRVVASLTLRGTVFLGTGEVAAAKASLEEAIAAARAVDNGRQVATALSILAEVHHTGRELDAAERLYGEALALFRSQGDCDSIGVTLCNLAMAWIERGEVDRARLAMVEALEIVESLGSIHVGHTVLEVLTGLAAYRGAWRETALFCGAAARVAEDSGLEPSPPDAAFVASAIERAWAAISEPAFAAGEQSGRGLDYEEAITRAREWVASISEVGNTTA